MDIISPAPARKVVTRAPGRTVRRINLPGIFDAPIECESSLERDFVLRAALCPSVAQLRHQPFHLALESGRRYTPDFLATSFSGTRWVVEVKQATRVSAYRSVFDEASAVLRERGFDFLVLTEEQIRSDRLHEQAALELTRFRGHIILCVQGVANVKSTTAVPGGIPPADGRAGSSRALTLAALS